MVGGPEEAQEAALDARAEVLPAVRPGGHHLAGLGAAAGGAGDGADGDELGATEEEAILARVPVGTVVIAGHAAIGLTLDGRGADRPADTGETEATGGGVGEVEARLHQAAGCCQAEWHHVGHAARGEVGAEALAHAEVGGRAGGHGGGLRRDGAAALGQRREDGLRVLELGGQGALAGRLGLVFGEVAAEGVDGGLVVVALAEAAHVGLGRTLGGDELASGLPLLSANRGRQDAGVPHGEHQQPGRHAGVAPEGVESRA